MSMLIYLLIAVANETAKTSSTRVLRVLILTGFCGPDLPERLGDRPPGSL